MKRSRRQVSSRSRLAVLTVLAVMMLPALAWADAMTLEKDVSLKGQGGVDFKIPAWKEARPATDQVAVFQHDGRAKGGDDFYLLMLTVEPGPTGEGKVDWPAIKDNVVKEAQKQNAKLALELKGDFADAAAFKGHRMVGTLESKGQKMNVELVALVAKQRLITVSVVSGKASPAGQKLAADVAKTTKIKTN